MFDIGFGELLVCAIVALLVLGPERLPTAARTVGRWVGRARHTVNHFTDQIDREIRAEQFKRRIEEEISKSGASDIARQVNEALHAPLKIPAPQPPAPAAEAAPGEPVSAGTVLENRIAPPAAAGATAAPEAPAVPATSHNPPTDRA